MITKSGEETSTARSLPATTIDPKTRQPLIPNRHSPATQLADTSNLFDRLKSKKAETTKKLVKILLSITALTLNVVAEPLPLELVFYRVLESYDPHQFSDDPSGNAVGWGVGPTLMAYLARFEATQDPYYLSLIRDNSDLVFANRSDRLGLIDIKRDVSVPAWVSTRYSDDVPFAWLVHAGNFMYPVARWIYLIKKDETLWSEFGWDAERYIDEITEVIDFFETVDWREEPSSNEGFFTGHFAPNLQEQPLPFNMMHTLGLTYVAMYLATGEARFREKAEKMARYWYNHLQPIDERFLWNYGSYTNRNNWIEDVSHGGISVNFAVECYRAGIFFSAADMERFAATFSNMVHPQGGFHRYIDGSGHNEGSETAHRWLGLSWFSEDILTHYKDWFTANWKTSSPMLALHASAMLAEIEGQPFAFEAPAPLRPAAPRPRRASPGYDERFSGHRLFNDNNPSAAQWFSRGFPGGNVNATHYVEDGRLQVTDVKTRASGNFTGETTFRRNVGKHPCDFLSIFHFGWDMHNREEPTLAGHRKAMPRISFRLLGKEGQTLAEVGLEDNIYSGSGEAFGALVVGADIPTGNGNFALSKIRENTKIASEAKFRLVRQDGILQIYLDEEIDPVFEEQMNAQVVAIEMSFGRRYVQNLDDAFFGQVWVETASIFPTVDFPRGIPWRLESFPEGLGTSVMILDDNKLKVSEVDSTAGGNFDTILQLTRPVETLKMDFESNFTFHWDMQNPLEPNLIGHRKAVPTVLLRLLDADGRILVEAGLEDRVYSGSTEALGNRLIRVDPMPDGSDWNSVFKEENTEVSGQMHVRMVRRAGTLRVYFCGHTEPLVEIPHSASIAALQLHFSRRTFAALPDAFFGTFWIKDANAYPPGPRFSWWREIHYAPETSFDDQISGAEAEFLDTGIANLLAYAFSPSMETNPNVTFLPPNTSLIIDGQKLLGLQVTAAAKPDLDYYLEFSPDLLTWERVKRPINTFDGSQPFNLWLPKPKDSVNIPSIFLRLRVSLRE
jgi:hypothetical protein